MTLRKLKAAALCGLIVSLALAPSAQATGDVWLEGSHELLYLPNVQFINVYAETGIRIPVSVREELVNDDGDLDGFRIDGGIGDIPIMGGAYRASIEGFFAWHDETSELRCVNNVGGGVGSRCLAMPIIFDPTSLTTSFVDFAAIAVSAFTTERAVNHWGVAVEVAQGPMGLKAGPAFRQIDQETTITGRSVTTDGFQLTYNEDLDTNYWGAFIGADGAVDLGGGWLLQGDAEAGLYWADTDYSGSYGVTNAAVFLSVDGNVNQQLSLESDKLAFIGISKISLEKDFGLVRLAGFGRVEYISSAPDMAYNDTDIEICCLAATGPDDRTRIGKRFAYSISTGARITVPMGSQ